MVINVWTKHKLCKGIRTKIKSDSKVITLSCSISCDWSLFKELKERCQEISNNTEFINSGIVKLENLHYLYKLIIPSIGKCVNTISHYITKDTEIYIGIDMETYVKYLSISLPDKIYILLGYPFFLWEIYCCMKAFIEFERV